MSWSGRSIRKCLECISLKQRVSNRFNRVKLELIGEMSTDGIGVRWVIGRFADVVDWGPAGAGAGEDLDRNAVFEALRGKVPYSSLADEPNLREAAADDSGDASLEGEGTGLPGGASDSSGERWDENATESGAEHGTEVDRPGEDGDSSVVAGSARGAAEGGLVEAVKDAPAPAASDAGEVGSDSEGDSDTAADGGNETTEGDDSETAETESDDEPRSIEEHVQEIVDGLIDQRLLDVAAQRGVSELLGREVGEFVKRPVETRVLTVGDLRAGSWRGARCLGRDQIPS